MNNPALPDPTGAPRSSATSPPFRSNELQLMDEFFKAEDISFCLHAGARKRLITPQLASCLVPSDRCKLIAIESCRDQQSVDQIREAVCSSDMQSLIELRCPEVSVRNQIKAMATSHQPPKFDLIYLNAPYRTEDAIAILKRVPDLLSLGGWLIVDNQHALLTPRNPGSDPFMIQGAVRLSTLTDQFITHTTGFGNHRVAGRYSFSQYLGRTAPFTQELDHSIFLALRLARVDPEYRRQLFDSPQSALIFMGYSRQTLPQLIIRESNLLAPLPIEWAVDRTVTVWVERPSWDIRTSRNALERLLGTSER